MTSIYSSSSTTSTAATSSTASSSILRINGMSSGIDTDAVVKSMLSSYQSKIDKANQAKQTLAWQQDSYRDIITGIKGLQDYFDPLSDKYMLSGKSLNINSVTNSDSTIVSGTVSDTAKTGTYKVSVSQLADQAKIEGTSKDSMINVTDLTQWSGKKLGFGTSWAGITLSSLTVGSPATPVTSTTPITSTNMSKLAEEINKQIAASVDSPPPPATATTKSLSGKISASYVSDGTNNYIKFTKLDDTATIALKATSATDAVPVSADLTINNGISSSSLLTSLNISSGETASFTLKNGSTSYPISLAVTDTTTIQNLMDSVNSATSGAIAMSLDDTTGKLTFQSKASGSTSNISIEDTSGETYLSNLGITAGSDSGADAIVAITAPGGTAATTTTQSSNKFTVNGVSYSLVGVNTTETPTSTVNVTADSDTVVTNIKSFIKDYNTIISTINTKLTEKKDSDYPPLTDTQKAAMSDTQIAAWEAKAKVGVLRNDDYLSSLMTQLRGTLYSPVYSNADSSTGTIALNFGGYGTGAIGIQTSTDYTDGGKLVITDESKLKDAIENNMDDFKNLLIGKSSDTLGTNEAYIGSSKYKEDGIFRRMDTVIRDYVSTPGLGEDGTYTLSGSMNIFVNKQYDFSTTGSSSKNTIPDQVYKKTLSITELQTQMEAASTRYYAKFSALETALNTLNTQQSTLNSMLGTSSSSS